LFLGSLLSLSDSPRIRKTLLATHGYLRTKLARPMRKMNANVAINATVVSMVVLLPVFSFKLLMSNPYSKFVEFVSYAFTNALLSHNEILEYGPYPGMIRL